jgi:hypothetical protein
MSEAHICPKIYIAYQIGLVFILLVVTPYQLGLCQNHPSAEGDKRVV